MRNGDETIKFFQKAEEALIKYPKGICRCIGIYDGIMNDDIMMTGQKESVLPKMLCE